MTERVEVTLKPDEPIPGQEYCLVSFISPEEVLKKKDVFFFQQFVNQFEADFKTKVLEEFLANTVNTINQSLEKNAVEFEKLDLSGVAQTCRNAKVRIDETLNTLQEFTKKHLTEFNYDKMKEKYDTFMYINKSRLENEFYIENEFKTTIRGLKFRGTYASQEEATFYAKKLQKKDPYFHIYSLKVGGWVPWDPEATEIKDQVYQEEELNTLMKKYRENEDSREEFYREMRNRNKNQNIENRSGAFSNENERLFNDVGDLALQRKIEASNSSKQN
jgi:hypothetical protein